MKQTPGQKFTVVMLHEIAAASREDAEEAAERLSQDGHCDRHLVVKADILSVVNTFNQPLTVLEALRAVVSRPQGNNTSESILKHGWRDKPQRSER